MSAVPDGLPEPLPERERLLWQGKPDWRVLARRTFHVFKLAGYFALLVAWVAVSTVMAGAPPTEAAQAVLHGVALSAVPLLLIVAYAWMVARSTVYTLTDRRLVMRVGLALPMTINLPFSRIAAADLNRRADGSGDIALTLTAGDRVPFLALWPHARPWRLARAEPLLRGLGEVQPVARMLARALAASAEMAVPLVQEEARAPLPIPHATMTV